MKDVSTEIQFLVEEVESKVNQQLESVVYALQHPEAPSNLNRLFEFTRAMVLAAHDTTRGDAQANAAARSSKQQLSAMLNRLRQQREERRKQLHPHRATKMLPSAGPEQQKTSIQVGEKGVVQHVVLAIDSVTHAELAFATFDDKEYVVHEPALTSDMQKLLIALRPESEKIKKVLLKRNSDRLKDIIERVARRENISHSPASFENLRYYLIRNFFRLGPIDPVLNDDHITQLICPGIHQPLEIVRNNVRLKTSIMFRGKDQLNALIKRIAKRAGQKIRVEDPIIDATIKDFRIQATFGTDYAQPRFIFTRIACASPKV